MHSLRGGVTSRFAEGYAAYTGRESDPAPPPPRPSLPFVTETDSRISTCCSEP